MRPVFTSFHHWVSRDRSRVLSFLGDFTFMIAPVYIAVQAVAVFGGLTSLAALRGAAFLFGPLVMLISGARISILPSFGETVRHDRDALRVTVIRVASGLSALAAMWSVVVLLLPNGFGTAVLGATWSVSRPLFVAIAIFTVVRCGTMAPLDGLRALGGGRRLLVVRGAGGALYLIGAVLGAAVGNALGAVDGMAIAAVLAAVVAWSEFWRGSFPPGTVPERAGLENVVVHANHGWVADRTRRISATISDDS
jgi:O-antigen/teichoic acid export membrane protein